MNDVARLSGVSLKSVSRVVNGESGASAETRDRVEAAVRELGYRRNDAAHALRRADGRTACIGLVVEDIGNPFAAALNRSIEECASAHGSLVLAVSTNRDPEREQQLVHRLLARAVDGLVIMSARTDHSYLAAELASGTPVVFVDRPPIGLSAPAVLSQNRAGARQATSRLLAAGHRRIAFIGDLQTIYTETERQQGFREALEEAGVTPDDALIRIGVGDSNAAEATMHGLLDLAPPPTAVFAANNLISVGVLKALHRAGAARSVEVIGFDDLDLAEIIDPPLTVIRQDPEQLGALAAAAIFSAMAGEEPEDGPITVPVELVVR
jgi:LacI family transcriptional regulator